MSLLAAIDQARRIHRTTRGAVTRFFRGQQPVALSALVEAVLAKHPEIPDEDRDWWRTEIRRAVMAMLSRSRYRGSRQRQK